MCTTPYNNDYASTTLIVCKCDDNLIDRKKLLRMNTGYQLRDFHAANLSQVSGAEKKGIISSHIK